MVSEVLSAYLSLFGAITMLAFVAALGYLLPEVLARVSRWLRDE